MIGTKNEAMKRFIGFVKRANGNYQIVYDAFKELSDPTDEQINNFIDGYENTNNDKNKHLCKMTEPEKHDFAGALDNLEKSINQETGSSEKIGFWIEKYANTIRAALTMAMQQAERPVVDVEDIAQTVLRAAGSEFKHYMPYTKDKIINNLKALLGNHKCSAGGTGKMRCDNSVPSTGDICPECFSSGCGEEK
jgi:hypothetical protein